MTGRFFSSTYESNEIERIVAIFTILNDIIFGQKPVPEDHSEVSRPGGTERVEIEPNADLRVVDRAFLHGDRRGARRRRARGAGRRRAPCTWT